MSTKLQRRTLGRTGESLTIIGFGGIVVVGNEQPAADRLVADAIERGVNYFDVAPSYADGEAEEKLGLALRGRRDGVFLACKTMERERAGAEREMEQSLRRLHTDRFDLYQLHALSSVAEVDAAFAPGGAMELLQQAREQGKVRFLGFSAHSAEAALAAMERFPFDTVLFPFNWVAWAQGGFGPQVMEAAHARDMGCLALKAMADSPWDSPAASAVGREEYSKCWYRPVTDPSLAALALRFTLSRGVTAAIPPGDERLFHLALDIAEQLQPLSATEENDLLARASSRTPLFAA